MEPRIKPLDKPKSILGKIMFYFLRKEFGNVIMPARVIYSRYPKMGMLVKKLYDVENSLKLVTEEDKLLIQSIVSEINGCTFCMDLARWKATERKFLASKFSEISNYKLSASFSEREKSMLDYVVDMTKNISVSDEIFVNLKKYFSDEEIIEITFVSSSQTYLNRLIKPLNIGSDELCQIN